MPPRARRPPHGRARSRQRSLRGKPLVARRAVVEGNLVLSPRAARAIRAGTVAKGDPCLAASLAGLVAMKRTAELIPHCHLVPMSGSEVQVEPTPSGVRVLSTAEATWTTGVEMEALLGATVALLTVWDMVKYLEKDARGQYPSTSLGPVRVVEKVKGTPARGS